MVSRWFLTDSIPLDLCIPYHHEWWLVAVSYLAAAFGSYTTFHLVARVKTAANPATRVLWLAIAGISMGCGIFAMHFIAMIAVRGPLTVRYDIAMTALSALFAIVASGVAFHFVDRVERGRVGLAIGSVILGSGIGLMHYTGMAALSMPARIYYDPYLFVLSVVVAVALSCLALYVLRRGSEWRQGWRPSPTIARLLGGLVMGLAVTMMHYTGMLATYFLPETDEGAHGVTFDGTLMAAAVGTAASLIGAIAVILALNADLNRRRRLEADLRQAKADAEAANATKSEFLAMMSHEIRTPMNGVLGMVNLILGSELAPQQREWAAIIKGSGEALLAILNDILDLSKIEAGRLELDPGDFDLRGLLRAVADLWEPRVRAKGLGFSVEIAADVPVTLHGDAGRIRQVLYNLVSNAAKFTEVGRIAIRVRQRGLGDGRVEVRFEVSDTGIGVAPEVQQRLFTKFSQADGSMTRKYGGTGLGLAICKNLAQLMGGRGGGRQRGRRGIDLLVHSRQPGARSHWRAVVRPRARARRAAASPARPRRRRGVERPGCRGRALIRAATPPCRRRLGRLHHVAEHILQDAAVPVVLDLVQGVDATDERHG